jgi:glycosyltransferase involved in cell wall biosynthesis
MVIARYLQQIVFDASQRLPIMLPNAIDATKFFITVPPQQRKATSVIMLYSKEPRKGSELGLTALKNVKNKISELEVNLFGVYEKPANLPEWITYHQKPANLATLYNNAAVFFSPSLAEGWALPPAEAMACGCAVVCTNIGGHADYAINQETALLCNPEDIADMEEKLIMMLLNNELRQAMALKGTELIANQFNWNNSVDLLQNCFTEKAS